MLGMRRLMFGYRARGFTLLELIVVLVIIALALSITSPMLTGRLSASKMKTATQYLAADLRQVRGEAIRSNAEQRLVLNLVERTYRVATEGAEKSLPENTQLTLFTAESERVDAESAAIRFYPDGSSTGGRVTLEDGKHQYEVDVNWLTGKVRILEQN